MPKWIKYILRPKRTGSTEDHPDTETLAALADGRLKGPQRDQCIHHLNRCSRCYDLLDNTLRDVVETEKEHSTWSRFFSELRPVQALAAGFLLVALVGGGLFWQLRLQSPGVLVASVELDKTLKSILVENERLTWSDDDRIGRLVEALNQKGIAVAQLDKIVLDAPYYSSKSFFGPKEILQIRVENGIAYLIVREQLPEKTTDD